MNEKLRYINTKKPLLSQISPAAKPESTDPDTLINRFEQDKKSDTTIKKIKKNYMAGLSSSERMK